MGELELIKNGEFSEDISPEFYDGYRYVYSNYSEIPEWKFHAIIATNTFFQGDPPPIPPPKRVAALQVTDNSLLYNNISQVVQVTPGEKYTLSLYVKQRYYYQAENGFHGILNILVNGVSITEEPFIIANWELWRKIIISPLTFTDSAPEIRFEQPYSALSDQGTTDLTTNITGISLTLGERVIVAPIYNPPFTLPNITLGSLPYPITSSNITSTSPAPFTYSSSNPEIASVSENLISVHSPGNATITAYQSAIDDFSDGSTSTQLTVLASSSSDPTPIQTGSELIYFMSSDAQYANITSSNLEIMQELVSSNFKRITTDVNTHIAKL